MWNATNNKGNTALMFANCTSMKSLLKAGAYVNTTNSEGITALMQKIDERNIECIKQLLEAEADVNIANGNVQH